ncbi:DNA translocase FtsK 4TM domain-containing protein [bacterium]|nr:DNA translocase FtsK 4TM domain-containing protein [bacterium]
MAKKRGRKKNKNNFKVKKRKKHWTIPEPIKIYIVGSLILFLAVFIILSYFNFAGVAGKYFLKGLFFLIGKAIYVLPFIFLAAGIEFLLPQKDHKWLLLLAILLLVFSISGSFALLEYNTHPASNFYFSSQGGVFGSLFAWPILKIFGSLIPWVLFFLLSFLGIVIIWYNLPISKIPKLKFKREGETKKEILRKEKRINIKKVFAPKVKIKTVEENVPIKLSSQTEEKKEKRSPLKIPARRPKKEALPISKIERDYKLPPLNLLEGDKGVPSAGDIRVNSEVIKKTLENFGIPVEMYGANVGPTVTQYTLKPAEGIKLSRITALSNNLALALAAHPIRIEAPIPGKSLIGIEVPNKARTLVRLRNLLSEPEFLNASSSLTFALGRDVMGGAMFADLSKMPHLLIAGATGTGKTICLNSIVLSLLYRNTPETLRLILVDPKRVEFSHYNTLPHVLGPVVHNANKTIKTLAWLIEEMERRFDIFGKVGARNIVSYNARVRKNGKFKEEGHKIMPYIVLIIDELADLMAARGRDIEMGIVKLAQKARATGIHLILATQRPSVEVITGLIKANIIARIAFQVASQVDSRTILDTSGAEKLLGNGDMLFISATITKPKRIQGAYVSEKEVERVAKFIKENQPPLEEDELQESITEFLEESATGGETFGDLGEEDPLYEEAKRLVIETRKASASFLQRKLRVGYARAARLLDMLEERGIVGPAQGAKPREVYVKEEKIDYSSDFPADYNEDFEELEDETEEKLAGGSEEENDELQKKEEGEVEEDQEGEENNKSNLELEKPTNENEKK